jgi:hypothetical protein
VKAGRVELFQAISLPFFGAPDNLIQSLDDRGSGAIEFFASRIDVVEYNSACNPEN